MILYNNATKLLFSQGQDNSNVQKSKASQSMADTSFKSILDKTCSSNNKFEKPVSVNNSDKAQNNDKSVKYKSFKDVEEKRNIKSDKDTVENLSKDFQVQKVESAETDTENTASKESEDVINVFAQMLGIQPKEFVKLAKELGYSTDDLKDMQKLSALLDKLPSVLELNEAQKSMLKLIADEVIKQVKTNDEATVKEASDKEVQKAPEKEFTVMNTKSNVVSKIADEIKIKLEQLIQETKLNPETVSSDISKVIEAMKAQTKAKVTMTSEIPETQDVENASQANDAFEGEQLSVKEKTFDGTDKQLANTDAKEKDKTKAVSEDTDNEPKLNTSENSKVAAFIEPVTQEPQVPVDVKVNKTAFQAAVDKAAETVFHPTKGTEIINQVIEQAKVTIGQDKSEMVIHLKPDHLGKLELKVVTEQGIVAAKFIAESQQVKEIIETNMQLLKDSLQKQGISIDGISVQVGSDRHNQYQQQNSGNSNRTNSRQFGKGESLISRVGINTSSLDILPERFAQYEHETNTINLTA